MKRSDLKKILMEEALKILAEKSAPSSPATLSEKAPVNRAGKNLFQIIRSVADRHQQDPDEETAEKLKKVGIDPETPTTDQEIKAAAEKMAAEEPKPAGMSRRGFLRKMMGKSDKEEPAAAAAEEEEEQAIYGLTSKKNPESLLNVLSKAGFGAEVVQKVVAKMKQLADDDNIVLEAVSLRGRGSEQDRVMNSESVGELISLVRSLGLGADQNRLMMKALNNWGNRNTVRFEKPTYAPAAPAAPEKPAAEPEKQDPRAAGGLTDEPDPAAAWEAGSPLPPERAPAPVDTPAGDDPDPWYAGKDDPEGEEGAPEPEGEKGAPEPEPEPEGEEEKLSRKDLIARAIRDIKNMDDIETFRSRYFDLLKKTEYWKDAGYNDYGMAYHIISKAMGDIMANAAEIGSAISDQKQLDDEHIKDLEKITNFGDKGKRFVQQLIKLSVAKLWVKKKFPKTPELNDERFKQWKLTDPAMALTDKLAEPGLYDRWNTAAGGARDQTLARTGADVQQLQEQKTLNRWKLLAGIK